MRNSGFETTSGDELESDQVGALWNHGLEEVGESLQLVFPGETAEADGVF